MADTAVMAKNHSQPVDSAMKPPPDAKVVRPTAADAYS